MHNGPPLGPSLQAQTPPFGPQGFQILAPLPHLSNLTPTSPSKICLFPPKSAIHTCLLLVIWCCFQCFPSSSVGELNNKGKRKRKEGREKRKSEKKVKKRRKQKDDDSTPLPGPAINAQHTGQHWALTATGSSCHPHPHVQMRVALRG